MKIELTGKQSALGCGFIIAVAVVGWGIGLVAGGSQWSAFVALGLALAILVGSVAFSMSRTRSAVYVTADEGGLRIEGRSAFEYVPFATLRAARLGSSFGRGFLHLETDAAKRSLPLVDGVVADLGADVGASIARARSPGAVPAPAMLARDGQPLDVWLERVHRAATGDGYRERAIDADELTRLVEDRAAAVELRAAAAHSVLGARDPDRAARVMSVLGPATPPIVVVAIGLGTPHGTYVAELEKALSYLSKGDRAVAERMLEARPARNLTSQVAS